MQNKHNALKGMIFSVGGFTCFALGDAIFKYLSASYSIFELIFIIGIFSTLMYLGLSDPLGGLKATLKTKNLKLHLLRGVIVTIQVAAIIYAFKELPLATVYALVFITPALTTLLSIVVLKEHVTLTHWLAIAAGFAGVLVILRPGMIDINLAALATLLSALMIAIANIMVRFLSTKETLLSQVIYLEIVSLPLMLLAMIPDFTTPTWADLGWMAIAGIINATGMLGIVFAFTTARAATVAPFHYIQIIWGAALGYFIFNDIPDLWTLSGAAIIIASGLWLIRHERTYKPVATPEIPDSQCP